MGSKIEPGTLAQARRGKVKLPQTMKGIEEKMTVKESDNFSYRRKYTEEKTNGHAGADKRMW